MHSTGDVSFWLGSFIIILSAVLFIGVFFLIKTKVIDNEGVDKLIDVAKWCLVSVAITMSAAIVNDGFREREQGLKEIEMFNKYVDTVMTANGENQRKLLSEYFATVSPVGPIRDAWINYERKVDNQITKTADKEKRIQELKALPASDLAIRHAELNKLQKEVDTAQSGSLAPVKMDPGEFNPRLFVQVSNKNQKEKLASLLTGITKTMNVLLPEFEIIEGYKGKNELRYFNESEAEFVKVLISNFHSVGLTVAPKFVKGYKVRPLQFELWISELN